MKIAVPEKVRALEREARALRKAWREERASEYRPAPRKSHEKRGALRWKTAAERLAERAARPRYLRGVRCDGGRGLPLELRGAPLFTSAPEAAAAISAPFPYSPPRMPIA